jgi:TRAP transporter TAXI family solute receptor
LKKSFENKYPGVLVTEDKGSTDYTIFTFLFEIYGITPEDYEAWGGKIVHTDNNTASEMLQDGTGDIMLCQTSTTSSLLTELTMTTPVIIGGFNDKVVEGLIERGFAERYIPAGTFGQFEKDTRTAFAATSVVVSSDMSDNEAYNLTKVLMENRAKMGESCATMRDITGKIATNTDMTVVPLHPGSVRYFQDIGVLDANGKYIGEGNMGPAKKFIHYKFLDCTLSPCLVLSC